MDQLIIYQKSYDCLLYLYIVLGHYPKSEKFTLASETKSNMMDFMTLLLRAHKSMGKRTLLFEADTMLETLRLNIRLGKDLKFISLQRYEILATKLNEIGRLLGGWIKSSK